MRIKDIETIGDVVLAPIAGYSDVGFRSICAELGAAITYTEMASAKGLYYQKSDKTKVLLHTTDSERIKAAQIFGSEPFYISEAVKNEALSKFDIIDINMGCPMPKITKNNEGSALMTNIELAKQIVQAAKKSTNKPITVKMRLGFDKIIAVDFAKAMEDAGADAITVHGRTRDEMYSGQAHWDEIAKVVQNVKIPVIANGDVCSKADYLEIKKQTGASGVMIARAALGNPNIFAEITGHEKLPLKDIILRHIKILQDNHNDRYILSNFKKQIVCYCKGIRSGKEIKEQVFHCQSIDELINIIEESAL